MASENESTKIPFNGETGNGRNKGRRNGKGPNKTPQRGVGIEKLEKMRAEEESLKSFDKQQQLLLNYGAFQFPHHQQVMINNNNINSVVGSAFSPFVGNKTGFCVGSASTSSSSSNGYGWFFRNPFENSSKELSSIPNLNHHHHHHQSLDLCLKKTRLNEENIMMRGPANYAKRDMSLEVWNHHHDFLGFMPQPQSSVSAYPTQNLHEKTRLNEENVMMRGTNARREMNHHNFLGFMPQPSVSSAFPTQNHDEVVAVHRKGDSSLGSGRVFMEYEFFPKKDGKSTTTTTTKDLFPTTSNSIGFGSGEASSSITVTSYGDSTTYDSVDVSLRL